MVSVIIFIWVLCAHFTEQDVCGYPNLSAKREKETERIEKSVFLRHTAKYTKSEIERRCMGNIMGRFEKHLDLRMNGIV